MGSQTTCYLKMAGIVTRADFAKLEQTLLAHGAGGYFLGNIEDRVYTEFPDMLQSQIPDPIDSLLRELHISYAWEQDASEDYNASVTLYDARSETLVEFPCDGGNSQILIAVDEAVQTDRLALAISAQKLWRNINEVRLTIIESAHQRLAALDPATPIGRFLAATPNAA